MPFITKPAAKNYKPTVEDCIALDTAMLRKNGMLLEFMDHRLQRRWQLGSSLVGDIFLTTVFTGDIAYPRLRTHNQNRTVAARATADRKTVGHLS